MVSGSVVIVDVFDIKHEQLDPIQYIFDPEQLDHPWPDNDPGGQPDPNMPQLEEHYRIYTW